MIDQILKLIPILLPTATVLAYLVSFIYQTGKYFVFGIPIGLISIDLTSILISLVFIGFIIPQAYLFFNAHLEMYTSHRVLDRRIKAMVLVALYTGLCFLQLQTHPLILIPLITAGSVFLLLFIWPLRFFRTKGYINKLVHDTKKVPYEGFIDRAINKRTNFKGIHGYVYMWLVPLLFLVFISGAGQALRETNYYISRTDPGYLVVTVEGSRAILVKYNSKANRLEKDLKVVDVEDLDLRYKKIDKLKLH
jgi:hypothetical protein